MLNPGKNIRSKASFWVSKKTHLWGEGGQSNFSSNISICDFALISKMAICLNTKIRPGIGLSVFFRKKV
jgi:hypothetical protein